MGSLVYKAPVALGRRERVRERVMDGTMAGPEAVQSATALIEERLAQEEAQEVPQRRGGAGLPRRPSSAVKGRKRLAATPVAGRGTGVPRAPFQPQGAPGGQGCWRWETEASAPRTEGPRGSGVGEPSWAPRDPAHLPGPEASPLPGNVGP